jgi:cation diffusion facilitator CzcD-associated flavoprotein CzcO
VTSTVPRASDPGPRIAIIGAGLSGLITAVKLTQAGIRSFTIIDREAGAGGTWRQHYPGIGVDVPSHLYSFSFKRRYDWSRSHATAAELREYLSAVMADYGLTSHCRFNTTITKIEWDGSTNTYKVFTDSGECLEYDVIVSATGLFHTPRHPEWPGLDTFEGIKLRPSAWEHEHDLQGKRVAIVGTGSTSIQITPVLARTAEKLYVFQRQPGWILPKPAKQFTPEERRHFMRPLRIRLEKWKWYVAFEKLSFRLRKPGKINEAFRRQSLDYIDSVFAGRPDLKEAVTPDYPFGGKRPIFDDPTSSFYQALKQDNVELVPRPVASVTADGIVDADGVERKIDALVMSTGYRVSDFLGTFELLGEGGRSLREFWAGEPAAFMGMMVPGFPNFFILYGPNTNGGTLAGMLEIQGSWVVRAIKMLIGSGASKVSVRPSAYERWDSYVRGQNAKTILGETSNYYKSESGKIVSEWPNSQSEFWLWARLPQRLSLVLDRSSAS